MNEYLLDKKCLKEEILTVINKTKPNFVKALSFLKLEADFNLGEFVFYMKGKNKHKFKIHIYNESVNLNTFWEFLEFCTDNISPLVFEIFHAGEEIVLYFETVNKNNVRFCVFNTIEMSKLAKSKGNFKYSYIDAEIDLDIVITRKRFIKQFYKILKNMFEIQDSISYFETPFIDYDFWIKDSEKIKNFLKTNKKGTKMPLS